MTGREGRVGQESDSVRRWADAERSVSVTLDRKALEGIRGDALAAFTAIPRRGMEAGGLLIGRVEGDSPVNVVIEDYRPISCEHRFGPSFALSEGDRAALASELERFRGTIIGLYRSYTGREAAFDAADLELMQACCSGGSLNLVLQPVSADQCLAAFLAGEDGEVWALGETFRFSPAEMQHANGAGAATVPSKVAPAAPKPAVPEPVAPESVVPSPVAPKPVVPAPPPPVAAKVAAGNETQQTDPAPEPPYLPPPVKPRRLMGDTVELPPTRGRWRAVAACVLIGAGAGAGYEWWRLKSEPEPIAAVQNTPQEADRRSARPVAPVPTEPSAVSPGGDQQPASQPAPVIDIPVVEPPPPPVDKPLPAEKSPQRRSASETAGRRTPDRPAVAVKPPVAIRRVQPGISEGIRARIVGRVVVPVRVTVSPSGKVTAATAQPGADGLYRYLAERAVQAARATTFEPARSRSGRRVAGETTLIFTFTP